MASAAMTSWVPVDTESHFPIQNIPMGVFSVNDGTKHIASAIGDFACDLFVLAENGLMEDLGFNSSVFFEPTLNAFMELERPCWRATRARIQELLLKDGPNTFLSGNDALKAKALVSLSGVQMHLPATIGDYTDFYSSREHATNVGIMFRGKDNALQPNWLHLPVGYHGRASSVVVSGTDIIRPSGQLQIDREDPKKGSTHGPCRLMDFELEMACYVGGPANKMGSAIPMENAEDRIFGCVLMNDWSARDIQAWEYVPLGPFTAKNFATSISPWVISLDALEPFRCPPSSGDVQVDPTPLPYITDPDYARGQYDVELQIGIQGANDDQKSIVSNSNLKHMYWNFKQQLVHHSISGCPMQAGDLLGTGTISGPDQTMLGSMLELSWRGSREITLENAKDQTKATRKFVADNDIVSMGGYAVGPEGKFRVGFGEVTGRVLPAGTEINNNKKQRTDTSKYTLHSYWRSTSSWRVRIAMALQEIDCEYVAIDLSKLVGNNSPLSSFGYEEYQEQNPMAQVPMLTHTNSEGKGINLTQSLAIIEYLEDQFILSNGGNSGVFPRDPLSKARAKEISEIINSGIQPLQNLSVLRSVQTALADDAEIVDGRGFATGAIVKGMDVLEKLIKRNIDEGSGPFAAGTSIPTIADICLVPQLYNAGRFAIDMAKYPTLSAVNALCASHAAFIKAEPENQPDAPKA